MAVDDRGFQKKIRLARRNFDKTAKNAVEDATVFMLGRLVEEVMNGETGTSYPKNYPNSPDGGSGFVGVVSGNLKRAQGFTKEGDYEYEIIQVFDTLAPYMKFVAGWSREKYGITFYEIAIKLYGPTVTKKLVESIKRSFVATNQGRNVNYKNPFPQ